MKKKDIFIQEEASSCGAVCILSVLSFYGGYIPLEKILEDTRTDKSGTNAYELVRALNSYGFSATGKKVLLDELKDLRLPAIAHVIVNGYEHFLVVYEITEECFVTMDPAIGKRIYSKSEFSSIYDGVLIEIIKDGEIPKYEKSKSILKLFRTSFALEKKTVLKITLLNILIILLTVFLSLHVKFMSEVNNILALSIAFLAMRTSLLYLSILRNYKFESLTKKIDELCSKTFTDHIFRLPLKILRRKRTGEVTRKVEELYQIKNLFVRTTILNTLDILSVVVTFIVMFNISKQVASIYFASCLLVVWLCPFFKKRMYRDNFDVIRLNDEYTSNFVEDVTALESIKNLNAEEKFSSELNRDFKVFTKKRTIMNKFASTKDNIESYIYDTSSLLANYMGFTLLGTSLTLVDLMALGTLYSIMFSSLESIIETISLFFKDKASFRSLCEFLDIEEEKKSDDSTLEFKNVCIKDLSYSYDSVSANIKNFSYNFQKGDKVLLRGPSGIGKSTLVKCLSGVLDNYEGSITINGIDVKKMGPSKRRQYIVYVGQEERLFRRSIEENVTLGIMDEKWFNEVVKMTGLQRVLERRVKGQQTALLEGATNLSGGERARVILARALYKKPAVLIIDETLSSVGGELEDEIIENLKSLDDLTLIYITHRDKEKMFDKTITFRKDGNYDIKCRRTR